MFFNHQVFGVGAGLIIHKYIEQYIPTTDLFVAIPLIMLGVLLPDIDTPNSKVGRLLPFLSYPIGTIFGHRSITHSLLFAIGLSCYGLTSDTPIIFWLGFGVLMHVLGDFFTPAGVPLLWPFSKRFKFVVTFSTGGIVEPVFAWGVFILGVAKLTL